MSSRVRVVASFRNGQSGWMLQWHDAHRYPNGARQKLSHWFADRTEAGFVAHRMRGGETFEEASAALWREVAR